MKVSNALAFLSRFLLLSTTCLLLYACSSQNTPTMSPAEASEWIEAFCPTSISCWDDIIVEFKKPCVFDSTSTVKLKDVVWISPSVKANVSFSDQGKLMRITPTKNLKEGMVYHCALHMDKILGVDSLKDFSFEFYVTSLQAEFNQVRCSVSQNDLEEAVITGTLTFNTIPTQSRLEMIKVKPEVGSIKVQPTTDEKTFSFTITEVPRKAKDYDVTLSLNSDKRYSCDPVVVTVPSLATFRVHNIELFDQAEPYVEIEFSTPLDPVQDLDGLISIDEIESLRYQRSGSMVRVYFPKNNLKEFNLTVSEVVRNDKGTDLNTTYKKTLQRELIPPMVEIPVEGNIIPGDHLVLPIRAVNLAAVDVEIVKVSTDNVLRFIASSELDDSHYMRRFSHPVFRKTVALDKDKSLDLSQWQNFSITLDNLVLKDPLAAYQICLYFRQEYSLYNRTEPVKYTPLPELSKEDYEHWNDEYSSYPFTYQLKAPYENWREFNWRERDDPTKPSYYMSYQHMVSRNLIFSNIGMIVKNADKHNFNIAVTDLTTALPLQGATITAYDRQFAVVGQGTTDSNGLAQVYTFAQPKIFTAKYGRSKTYLNLNSYYTELSTSAFDTHGVKVEKGVRTFVYGERGVWRPGDEVNLCIIVEDKDGNLPKNHPVVMELYTPKGVLYNRQVLSQGQDGFYVFKTKTSEDAPTGIWRAKFDLGSVSREHQIAIETIKPNRLKINILSDTLLQEGDNNNFALDVNWLNGATASNLKSTLKVNIIRQNTPFKQWKDYTFLNPLSSFTNSEYVLLSGKLDQNGHISQNKKLAHRDNSPGMMKANLTATVDEPSGDQSMTSRMVTYSPFKAYVGINLGNKEFITDKEIKLPVVVVDPGGNKLSNRKLDYKVYRIEWSWWYEASASDLNNYIESSYAEVVDKGKVDITSGEGTINLRIDYPSWGRYLVLIKDQDGHSTGGLIKVDNPYYMGRAEDEEDASAASILTFSLDKRSYQTGETAKVYLPKASAGARVLLSIENGDKVVRQLWVNLSANKDTTVPVSVTSDMAPNFFVSAIMLQPHAQTVNDAPIRMYGIQRASVYDKSTKLDPVINVAKGVKPLEEFTVNVRERSGKPMTYTLAIVDEGLLDVTAFKTPKPWEWMNRERRLEIRTWDMFDDVFGAYTGKFTPILSVGGDMEINSAYGKEKRFNPVAMFLGPFTLNSGSKTHRITLPMYVGSLKVMVVAAHKGCYGSSDERVRVSSELMILPTLPRKLNCSDSIKVPVNVFFRGETAKDVNVEISVDGPVKIIGEKSKRISFNNITSPASTASTVSTSAAATASTVTTSAASSPASSPAVSSAASTSSKSSAIKVSNGEAQTIVYFDLCADQIRNGKAKIVVKASADGMKPVDETIYIDVDNPQPLKITAQNFDIPKSEKKKISWAKEFSSNPSKKGEACVEVYSMPTLNFTEMFSIVENYPFCCSEQCCSNAMFLLYSRDFLNHEDASKSDKLLNRMIRMILSRQLPSGGIPYWPGDSEAHPWVSSMATEVLSIARQQGFNVNVEAMRKLIEYQKRQAKTFSSSQKANNDIQQAYRLYTLTLCGEQPTAAMNILRESRSLSKLAALRLASAYKEIGRDQVANILVEKVKNQGAVVQIDQNGDYSMFYSPLSFLAIEADCYSLLGMAENALNLALNITNECNPEDLNTQEMGMLSAAMYHLCQNTGKGEASVAITSAEGKTTKLCDIRGCQSVSMDYKDGMATLENEGDQKLQAALITKYQPSANTPIEAVSNGVKIGVKYYDANHKPLNFIDLNSGDQFQAVITIANGDEASDAMALTFAIPTGWEIENQRLQQGSTSALDRLCDYYDIRDDKVICYFSMGANQKKTFVVKLRAAYAGDYIRPAISVEDMYNLKHKAIIAPRRVKVRNI